MKKWGCLKDQLFCLACAIFVLIAPLSCGRAPDFYAKYGIEVFTNGLDIDKEEINQVVNTLILILSERNIYSVRKMTEVLHGVEIEFHPDVLECPEPYKEYKCAGLATEDHVDVYFPEGQCLAMSALGHELLHVFHFRIEDILDLYHKDARFFSASWEEGMFVPVESNQKILDCEEMCPTDACHLISVYWKSLTGGETWVTGPP